MGKTQRNQIIIEDIPMNGDVDAFVVSSVKVSLVNQTYHEIPTNDYNLPPPPLNEVMHSTNKATPIYDDQKLATAFGNMSLDLTYNVFIGAVIPFIDDSISNGDDSTNISDADRTNSLWNYKC